MSYSSEVLADAPLGYWHVDEASGTTFADSSGNSRTATISGTLTLAQSPATAVIGGSSITGAGAGNAPTAAATWLNSATAFSLECWFKTTSTGTVGFLGRDESGQTPRQSQLKIAAGQLQFIVFDAAINTSQINSPTSVWDDGAWHHLVATAANSGSDVVQKLYVDGSQIATLTWTAHQLTTVTGNCPFYLAHARGANLTGSIDEPAVYGTALSAARVAAHYTAGTTSTKTGTAAAAIGGLTASAAGNRATSGTASAALGGVTAAASSVRTTAGTATAALGGLTAAATAAAPEIDGTASAALGSITATATGTRTTLATANAALGALVASAAGTRTDLASASAALGVLTAAATGASGGSGVALANLGALIAAAIGTVTGVIVAPVAGPFRWGFTMLAPSKALIPVEAGLDFIEWGFVMLQPGDALIGDPA